jgi:hypothetical protein
MRHLLTSILFTVVLSSCTSVNQQDIFLAIEPNYNNNQLHVEKHLDAMLSGNTDYLNQLNYTFHPSIPIEEQQKVKNSYIYLYSYSPEILKKTASKLSRKDIAKVLSLLPSYNPNLYPYHSVSYHKNRIIEIDVRTSNIPLMYSGKTFYLIRIENTFYLIRTKRYVS